MRTKILHMGNSSGICIPKIILEQCNMENFVDVQIVGGKIVINPVSADESQNIKRRLQEKSELESLNESCWYEDETEWK